MLVIITLAALDGPRLVTVIVKLKLLDTGAEPGDTFNEIARSEFGVMVMGTLALLLAVFVSRTLDDPTEAVFVYTPSILAWAMILTVAEELFVIVPRLQVIKEPVWETEAPAGG